jgi:hypothetical protein
MILGPALPGFVLPLVFSVAASHFLRRGQFALLQFPEF